MSTLRELFEALSYLILPSHGALGSAQLSSAQLTLISISSHDGPERLSDASAAETSRQEKRGKSERALGGIIASKARSKQSRKSATRPSSSQSTFRNNEPANIYRDDVVPNNLATACAFACCYALFVRM